MLRTIRVRRHAKISQTFDPYVEHVATNSGKGCLRRHLYSRTAFLRPFLLKDCRRCTEFANPWECLCMCVMSRIKLLHFEYSDTACIYTACINSRWCWVHKIHVLSTDQCILDPEDLCMGPKLKGNSVLSHHLAWMCCHLQPAVYFSLVHKPSSACLYMYIYIYFCMTIGPLW